MKIEYKLKGYNMIIYKFIRNLILHRKYSKILKKIYKEENILSNLSLLFEEEFRMDWIGRIYVVLNPNLNKNKLDINNQVYEYNENGFDNRAYVEKWVMDNLNIASKFIKNNNLFELLTYEIKRLDDYDNYLLIIQPITLEGYMKSLKKFIITYSSISVILFFLIKFLL